MNYEHEMKAKVEAQARYQQAGQIGVAYAGREVPAPSTEPTLTGRLKETIGYLAELADIQGTMRRSLVGPEPCDVPPQGGSSKNAIEPPIEQLLSEVCQRAAMLVSEARSIKNRL